MNGLTHASPRDHAPWRVLIRLGLLVGVLLAPGCGDRPSPSPLGGPDFARGGNGNGGNGGAGGDEVVVASVDPDTARQGQTLDVLIEGEGFVDGSVVEWELDGVPTSDIATNQVSVVNSRRLRANITVSDAAATERFDIVVRTPPGRRGIGSELFEVKRKGNPNDPIETASFEDPVDPTDLSRTFFSDGGGAYRDLDVDVSVGVARQFLFNPYNGGDRGKQPDVMRRFCLRFGPELSGAGIPPELAEDLDGTGMLCDTGDFRTVWHSNEPGGLEVMSAVGESIRAEARLIWTDAPRDTQFKLEFFCPGSRGEGSTPPQCANLLDITLVDVSGPRRTWRIVFDVSLVAGLSVSSLKGRGTPFERVAEFRMPFEIAATREDVTP